MSDEAILGKERVNGKVYEWPFQVIDGDGEGLGPELDDVPPFLNQQEIDALTSKLLDTNINTASVADALRKLPDSEAGRDEMPEQATIVCVLCGESIDDPEELTQRFGKFCHDGCDR